MKWIFSVCVFILMLGVAAAQQVTNISNETNKTAVTVPMDVSHGSILPKNLKDWIDVIQGVFVILASCAALWGINSWRRKFDNKRRIELAEEVLPLFIKAKDIIVFIRDSSPGECSTRKPEPTETEKQRYIRNKAYITVERYQTHFDTFDQLFMLRYRFMTLFENGDKPFGELKSVLDDICVARKQWIMLSEVDESIFTGPQASPQALQEHRARIEKNAKILWMEEHDPISTRVENAVNEIERLYKLEINHTGKTKPCCQ